MAFRNNDKARKPNLKKPVYVRKPIDLFNRNNEAKICSNYFVSIPIESSYVIRKLEYLTSDLAHYNRRVQDVSVPKTSYHLTLCTLHIGSAGEWYKVRKVLERLSQDKRFMSTHLPVSVKFEGIGEFFNKVLYVNCHSQNMQKLVSMKQTIEKKLREAGINVPADYGNFVPHLTVLKIASKSNLSVGQLLSRDIRQKYDKFNFGTYTVNRVDLCKMTNIFNSKTYPVVYTIRAAS